jgi:hypothetical protein
VRIETITTALDLTGVFANAILGGTTTVRPGQQREIHTGAVLHRLASQPTVSRSRARYVRYGLDPALVVSVVPNAAMAHVAFSRVLHLAEGESVLVHGALGGFAAAFPGIARQLGASRVGVRTRSLDLMKPGGRLLACGNASGDWRRPAVQRVLGH